MRRTGAFTLIELLLATVLSTMLMIGVMAVVARLGAPGRPVDNQPAPDAALDDSDLDATIGLLREDLGHAANVGEPKTNELVLTGFAALDARSLDPSHRPARVVYRLEPINGRNWLVRSQAALDNPAGPDVQRDLVCSGVTRFELVRSGSAATSAGGSIPRSATAAGTQAPAGEEARPGAPPGQFRARGWTSWRLRIWTGGQTQPAFDRLVAAEGVSGP